MQRIPALSDLPVLTERLVRDYVRRGIVSGPEHVGREAVYGFRQLLELIAARVLVADGWPLRMIAQTFKGAGEDALLEIVEGRKPEANEAIRHDQDQLSHDDAVQVTRFMTALPADMPLATGFTSQKKPTAFLERAADVSKMRADARAARQRLQLNEAEASARSLVLFDIAPWAILGVETERLKSLTDEQCEDLTRAVRGALIGRHGRGSG